MGSLLEMMFVLLGAALLTVQGIKADVETQRASMLALEGQNEATLVSAFEGWISENFATVLTEYTASGNVAALTPPTIDQLVAAGNLKQAQRASPFWGGSYAMTMTMVPAGCTQASSNCHVAFSLFPTTQLLRGGKPDVAGAAQIALAGSKLAGTSQFGYSNSQTPGTISGINGSFTATNPLGATAASILATNGPDTDGGSVYIRRDGSLTWTGDQDVNNVSLNNVNDIEVNTVEAGGAVTAASVGATGAIAASGAISAGSTVAAATTVKAGTMLIPGNVATDRAACSPNSAMSGASDGSGLIFSCQSGIWLPVGGPKLWNGYYVVANGSTVPNPGCAGGGTPGIVVNPQSMYIDPTAALNSW